MEITKENIAEILTNQEFISDILPSITASEGVQTMITNGANTQYQTRIDEEVRSIHTKYDDDMFEALGVRPGTGDDGKRMKTYESIKVLYGELKGLRGQKDSMNKDAKVIELNNKIAELEKGGGGQHVQDVFDQAKVTWDAEKAEFKTTIEKMQGSSVEFQKKTEIANAIRNIKFNPDTPESIKKMVLDSTERMLIAGSKIIDGKVIFVDAEGKPVIDPTSHTPKTAEQMLKSLDAIKDISLKDDQNKGGGGADPTIDGKVQTTKVEGKDVKTLILPEGIKTRSEFVQVADKALIDSGISRRDPDWDKLKNKAYNELNIAKLPIQ